MYVNTLQLDKGMYSIFPSLPENRWRNDIFLTKRSKESICNGESNPVFNVSGW